MISVVALVLLVLACAAPAATPSQPAKPGGATTAAAQPVAVAATRSGGDAAATPLRANPAEWQRLQDAARSEGRVVVNGQGFPGFREGVVDGFQKAYGIAVEYLGLNPGEIVTRIDREAQVGRPTVDVAIGGSSSCWTMAERGYLDDVTKLIVDPSLFDPAVWRGGAMRVVKPSPQMPKDMHCGLQTGEYVMTDLFVNSQLVSPSSIKTWKDLLRPEYKGKIASHDPRRAGSSGTTAGYLYALFGEQYLKDLYVGQQLTFTADYRQLAEWVARGTYPIGLSLVVTAIEALRAQGLPLERVFPEDGPGAVTGGTSVVMKIKDGPNPNAAAVFLNWFASQEAQAMYEREIGEMSLRTDVPHAVAPYTLPRPGVAYTVDDYDPGQFFGYRAPATETLQELLGR